MIPPRFLRRPVRSRPWRSRRPTGFRRAYVPSDAGLEDRILLSGSPAGSLGAAIPIELGRPVAGLLAANAVVLYQVEPTADGILTARAHAPGGVTRLTLLDAQGHAI